MRLVHFILFEAPDVDEMESKVVTQSPESRDGTI